MEILKSGPSTPDGVQNALNYAQDDMGEEWVDRVGSYENEGRGPFGPRSCVWDGLCRFVSGMNSGPTSC